MAQVALLMGSKNDYPKLETTVNTLKEFGVEVDVRVMSAHRTPAIVCEYAANAIDNGLKVFICAAGCAAHLAGVVAGHTTLPVIGIPVAGGPLQGLDALYATVQMPGGIPVASVAVGGGGPKNAALFAIQILALSDATLAQKLVDSRQVQAEKVVAADNELQQELKG
jgi:5-(carboxyamino)imidazole ribonucleotide mutase